MRAVAALHAETVSKEEFKEAISIKKRNLKAAKEYIKQTREISLEEQYENYKIAYASNQKEFQAKPKVTRLANTNMDKATRKNKDMEAFKRQDLSKILEVTGININTNTDKNKNKEETLYLFETDKILDEEYKSNLGGIAYGY